MVNALGDNDKRSTDKKQPDHERGERFCFTVTIGMIFVRRTNRNFQSEVNREPTENVRKRFETISHEGERVTDKSGNAFG